LQYLKRIIRVLIIFFLLLIIISLFLSSNLEMKKSVVLDADMEVVKKEVNGFAYNSLVGYKVKPENEIWTYNESKGGVELVSEVKIDLGFNPINKFLGFFDQEEVGKSMRSKLDSLRMAIEDLPKIHQVRVKKVYNKDDQFFLSIRDTVNQFEINNVHGKLYAEINRFIDSKGIKSDAPPIVIYHFWSDTLIDIEAGIPVSESIALNNERIKLNVIPKGNEWMRKNKVMLRGVPWEVYLTDPSNEPNPENWETAIYFPVE